MITLKEQILYHSVADNSYDYVKKNGITPDEDGFIYLSTRPLQNQRYTHSFKVTVPDEDKLYDWREFWQDEEGNDIDFDHEWDPENPYFMYMGKIPPEYIEEV